MTSEVPNYDITIPIYEGVDLMDVAAPVEFFSWMATYWTEKKTTISLAAVELHTIRTRDGLILTPERTFEEYDEKHLQADLIWVPGGDLQKYSGMLTDETYLNFLQQQSIRAEYVTSVCEGALLLAAAGLLDGYRATTHWKFIPCLEQLFQNIRVADGFPRFVVDGNRITGGGVSSGLDEALKLISLIAGDAIAKQVQMTTQYFPDPPFSQEMTPTTTCPISHHKLHRPGSTGI